MDKYRDIKEKMLDLARKDEDIKAIVRIGSSTRDTVKADAYSDLDMILFTPSQFEDFLTDGRRRKFW